MTNKTKIWYNIFLFETKASDESKINMFGADGKTRIWRKSNEKWRIQNLNSIMKHGGKSVMV